MRRYRHLVTFQEPTYDRTSAGQQVATYDNVAGLTDLPANIIPVVEEEVGERMVLETDLHQIIVHGDRDIRPEMMVVTTRGVFDIKRVANPTLGRPATLATIVWAERVAL